MATSQTVDGIYFASCQPYNIMLPRDTLAARRPLDPRINVALGAHRAASHYGINFASCNIAVGCMGRAARCTCSAAYVSKANYQDPPNWQN